jgi:hypothetical protein
MKPGYIGFLAGIASFCATLAYDIAQSLQVFGVLRFPADEIAIYGTSLCIVIPFLLEMAALHQLTHPEKRFWTQAAFAFAVVYAIFVSANYVVQLATVIPAKLQGVAADVQLLEQSPHSLFWDFDAIGYIAMGIASLLAVPALDRSGFERWVRMALIANALVTPLISIVYFYPVYSAKLLSLGAPWGVTAPFFMLMVALMLRSRQKLEDAACRRCRSKVGDEE